MCTGKWALQFAFVAAALSCRSASAAITVVASNCIGGGGVNSVTSPAINGTGGNSIVVFSSTLTTKQTVISDSLGNIYTPGTGTDDINGHAQFFTSAGATVSGSFTITSTISGGFPAFCWFVLGNTNTASLVDQVNGNLNNGGNSLSPGMVLPLENNEIVITGICFNALNTMAIDSGFSSPVEANYTGGISFGSAASYLIQTTATSVMPTWTWPLITSASSRIVTLKFSAPPPPSTAGKMTLLMVGP